MSAVNEYYWTKKIIQGGVPQIEHWLLILEIYIFSKPSTGV